MSGLYNILTIYVNGALMLVCGTMLLFAAIPATPLSGNYRRVRRTMAGAYLAFFTLTVVELLLQSPGTEASDTALMQAIALSVAATQAFLFTFATLALLETRWPGWKYLAREAACVALFIAAILSVYTLCPAATFADAFWGFAAVYLAAMVRYTFMFVRSYRRFRRRMDDFFSGDEADRMRWIAVSFFGALAVGVTALFSALFISPFAMVLFAVVFDVFYTWFAIRFIGYAVRFPVIEEAMGNELPEEDKHTLHPSRVKTIETNLEIWKEAKMFLRPGITLGETSTQIGTNSKYLSVYINQKTDMSFREWVNLLKIEEAKSLLLEYPDMGVSEIAAKAGFVNSSHFGRLFRGITEYTPGQWRKSRT